MEELSNLSRPNPIQAKHLELIDECRNRVNVYLTSQLNALFEQIEPVFIDFAKKAESDVIQRRFFDSINYLLSHRNELEHTFRSSIETGFNEFKQGLPISYPVPPIETANEAELGVVDNDVLEVHLAIQNMIAKTANRCYLDLYTLGKRLAVVRGGKALGDDDIPACPAHIANAFQEAAQPLEIDKQIRLLFYFMFGKTVMDQAGTIYADMNVQLINADILPNIKLTGVVPPGEYRKKSAQTTANKKAASSEERPAVPTATEAQHPSESMPLGEELFQSIHDLLSQRRAADPEYRDHPEFQTGGDRSQLLVPPVIAQALGALQPRATADYLPDPDSGQGLPQSIALDPKLLENLRQTLDSERNELFKTLDKKNIASADLDTIELVGMLFEQVLDAEDLANITKALISHLHTPFLKVAILDRTFLTDESHIARKLLNLMIDAGKRWIDEDDLRRGIYYPLQELIRTILAEFKNDLSIFPEMYQQLERKCQELEHRARILEERTQEATKGRERLESARTRARTVLQSRCKGRGLHPAIHRFLSHAWYDRLILMLLRDPDVEQSKEWTSAMAVIDSLVRVTEARKNPKARQWLENNHHNLITHIKAGLNSLGDHHHSDSDALFALLDAILKESPASTVPQVGEAAASEQPEQVIGPVTGQSSTAEDVGVPKQPTEEEQKMLLALKKVKFGTWFELLDETQQQRRLKLSWFSPITHKYMFVDRFGIQAYILPSEELARQLCSGQAEIIKLDGLPFVSQALKTIHNILKKTIGLYPAK